MGHWGIVGGGLLGMTLAYRLRQQGQQVTLLEAGESLGGLASAWSLGGVVWDRHYHVILLSDSSLRRLLAEIGLEGETRWSETKTGFYTAGRLHSLSNAIEFLRFPPLNLLEKCRLAATILYASRIRDWKRLEGQLVADWLARWSGRGTCEKIWLPLLRAKLGECYRRTSAAFIWATIARMYAARRTGLKKEMFGYVQGGYAQILERFTARLLASGVTIKLGAPTRRVALTPQGRLGVSYAENSEAAFDHVVLTVPAPVALRVCPDLSAAETEQLRGIEYVGIVCASLLLKRPLTPYYVTNITDSWVPFTAVIEMSALVDRAQFGGRTLVYLPKYASPDDPVFSCDDREIERTFVAGLRRMHPSLAVQDVLAFRVSRVRYVFTLPTLGYSARLPPTATSIPGLHIINSAHIVNGTLNVNETLQLAERMLPALLREAERSWAWRTSRREHAPVTARPLASVSLDLDNQWSYMKTHGDPGWDTFPSYLDVFVPHVLDALAALELKITVFVVGQDAALERNREALRSITERGHEVGNHSFHHEQWIHTYSRDRIESELAEAAAAIGRATGHAPRGFRGPGFSWSEDLLEALAQAGYLYDASTLPTYIGPLARLYYFRRSSISGEEMERRKNLFGGFGEGRRPVKPYLWQLRSGRTLLEIPVTTVPLVKTPFHLSYLLYLSRHSGLLMSLYLRLALGLCRLTGTEPSFLLHPLDLLGPEQAPQLAFFPGMDLPAERKLRVFNRVLRELGQRFTLVNMGEHARRILERDLPLVPVHAGTGASGAER